MTYLPCRYAAEVIAIDRIAELDEGLSVKGAGAVVAPDAVRHHEKWGLLNPVGPVQDPIDLLLTLVEPEFLLGE